jgi:hypothetical protein
MTCLQPSLSMRHTVRGLIAAGSLLLSCGGVGALEATIKPGPSADVSVLEITGTFEVGDSLKIRAEVAKVPAENTIIAEFKNVGGGIVAEAMSMGRLFRSTGVKTVIPANGRCISPCPLAFLAGYDRRTQQPAMVKHSTSRLGVSSSISRYTEKDYTSKDLDSAISTTQKSILTIADYIQEIRADVNFMKFYFKPVADKNVNYFTDENLLGLGVSIFDDQSKQLIDGQALRRRMQ